MTLLFPASLAFLLLPFIRFGPASLRMLDLLRLMLGNETGLAFNEEILLRLTTYLSPFLYPTAALLIAILAAFLISLCLPQRGACYLALLFSPLLNVGLFFLLRQIWDKLEEVRPALSFFSLEDVLALISTTVLLWFSLWAAVMLCALVCLALSLAVQAKKEQDAFLPEMTAIDSPAYRAAEQDYRDEVSRLRQAVSSEPPTKPPAETRFEPVTVLPEDPDPLPGGPMPAFSGAVLGQSGHYRGLAYPLRDRLAVYFSFDGHEVSLQTDQSPETIAELYYVSQYQEYCLRPLRRLTVFLSSSQPLGANRCYFLPRGTEFYLCGQSHAFSLA